MRNIKINDIVIVGGGSSGWLSAIFLLKYYGNYNNFVKSQSSYINKAKPKLPSNLPPRSIDINRKFEIEASWNTLKFDKYKNQVEVDINKIKKKLKKEESRLNKQEIFLLSEILFSAENKEKLDKKYKKILKSIKEIGFKNTANIYSTSDTAKFGGSLGWIQQNQMSKIVINELSKINVGEFTKAISIPGGLLIVKIDEKKVNELEIDFDRELKKMIQFEKNKQLSQFSSIYYKKIKNNIKINEN